MGLYRPKPPVPAVCRVVGAISCIPRRSDASGRVYVHQRQPLLTMRRRGAHVTPSPLTRSTWSLMAAIFFLLTLCRSFKSIGHLPPDPGLEFQTMAWSDNLVDALSSHNGYVQVLPRLLSEMLNLVPLSQLTYWSTLLNALLITCCALAITRSLLEVTEFVPALIVGVTTSVAFAAYEGLVGNLWAVRWVLLPTACIVASIPSVHDKYWRLTLLLFIATGLSHAYIFIPAGAFIVGAIVRRDVRRKTVAIGSVLIGLTILQLLVFVRGPGLVRLYGDDTYYTPWPGAGIFWWSVFVLPLGFAAIALIPSLNWRHVPSSRIGPELGLALQATFMAVLSYLQLGIKSSPAVATINLSFAAVVVVLARPSRPATARRHGLFVAVLCSIVLSVLSLRYFFPSSYLTSGRTWPVTVELAATRCAEPGVNTVELVVLENGDSSISEDVSCDELPIWDRWFFQR